jgi:hypothetical protein
MPFTPKQPFPKARGQTLRSEDWNDLIAEVQRLDTAKVNKAGDIMTAPLTINAALAGTQLSLLGTGSSYLTLRAASGGQEILVGADGNGGIVSTMSNHDLQLRAGGNTTHVHVKASGRVGIGTNNPSNMLHVNSVLGVRAGDLYLAGGLGWSSLTYNAYHNEANNAWVFPNNTRTAVTVEMDDRAGNQPRFEIYSTTATNRTAFVQRLAIDGNTGNILMGAPGTGGSVGINSSWPPGDRLHVGTSMTVGPFRGGSEAQGRLTISGTLAELALVRRNLPSWPASPAKGDRFVIYNENGGNIRFWAETVGDIMTISPDGDMWLKGRLSTMNRSFVPLERGWGGGLRTWDIEAEGTIWSRNVVQTGPRDLAETFSSTAELGPGDVVCMDTNSKHIIPTHLPHQTSVIGIVSTEPGMLLGARSEEVDAVMFPVALAGLVPCKVVNENGAIQRGDLLTSSSVAGHAMKSTPMLIDGQPVYRPGTVIGKAMSSLEGASGVVNVLVTLM